MLRKTKQQILEALLQPGLTTMMRLIQALQEVGAVGCWIPRKNMPKAKEMITGEKGMFYPEASVVNSL